MTDGRRERIEVIIYMTGGGGVLPPSIYQSINNPVILKSNQLSQCLTCTERSKGGSYLIDLEKVSWRLLV